jgi:hypothetical protein
VVCFQGSLQNADERDDKYITSTDTKANTGTSYKNKNIDITHSPSSLHSKPGPGNTGNKLVAFK